MALTRTRSKVNSGREWLRRTCAILVASISVGSASCALAPASLEDPGPAQLESDLQVVTTFLPMTQFTKAVVGDRAEVVQLLPANVGPHDFQAKPADVAAIASADVLVQNGLELESFLEALIANANNPDLIIIDSSEGVDTLPFAEVAQGDAHGNEEEAHDHAEESHAEEAHDHAEEGHDHAEESAEEAHDEKGEHGVEGHHHHGGIDPHIWLDPKRAIEQVENIREGLIEADPEGESEYTANAAVFIEQLQALDQEIESRLAPFVGQTFITFHDFAFYFADSYGLTGEFLVDIPDENPSPQAVQRIIETTKAANLKALLVEPQFGEVAFAALASDLGVEVSVFDPMETGESAATEPDAYFTIMRRNVTSLEDAFGE